MLIKQTTNLAENQTSSWPFQRNQDQNFLATQVLSKSCLYRLQKQILRDWDAHKNLLLLGRVFLAPNQPQRRRRKNPNWKVKWESVLTDFYHKRNKILATIKTKDLGGPRNEIFESLNQKNTQSNGFNSIGFNQNLDWLFEMKLKKLKVQNLMSHLCKVSWRSLVRHKGGVLGNARNSQGLETSQWNKELDCL